MTAFIIRQAADGDAAALLGLMRELASFEGYIEQFCVREADLRARGLGQQWARQFTALVADAGGGQLLGYAVVYLVPYTYDLRPNLILKELYVCPATRGQGVGRSLMAAVRAYGVETGCARLKWEVLTSNAAAQAFYRGQGGRWDLQWQGWIQVLA